MKLSEENVKKLVFGGIYTASPIQVAYYCDKYCDSLNDQKYGWWVPVHTYNKETDEYKYYMIDTYQLDSSTYDYSTDTKTKYEYYLKGLERLNCPEEKCHLIITILRELN